MNPWTESYEALRTYLGSKTVITSGRTIRFRGEKPHIYRWPGDGKWRCAGGGVVGSVQETPTGAYDSWLLECDIQCAQNAACFT